MIGTRRRTVSWRLLGLACAVSTACSAHLEVRAPPRLPVLEVRAPAPPEPSPIHVDPFTADVVKAAARGIPDLRAATLAISLQGARTGPAASWPALAFAINPSAPAPGPGILGVESEVTDEQVALLDAALPELLLGRGLTRVIYPASLRRILARVHRERTEATGRATTTLVGSLDRMAELGGAVPADFLLALEGAVLEPLSIDVPITYAHAAPALASYGSARDAFVRALAAHRAALGTVAGAYRAEYRAASQKYEARGGQYEEPQDQAARAAYADWEATATALERKAASAEPPSLEALAADAAGRRSSEPRSAIRLSLRARLIDLRSGETFWMTRAMVIQPTAPAAARRALEEVLLPLTERAAAIDAP